MIFLYESFSLIFYHSVWLGFELFGLRAQIHSQLVQFTLVRKPQTGNMAGVRMMLCPEEMALRI